MNLVPDANGGRHRRLVAVAKRHGLDLSVDNLRRRYALTGPVKSATELLRIVIEAGFHTLHKTIDWSELTAATEAFPVMALRRDDSAIVLDRYLAEPDRLEAFDPLGWG